MRSKIKFYRDDVWCPDTGVFDITVSFEYDGKTFGVTERVAALHHSTWTKLESVAREMYRAIGEVRVLDREKQGSRYL